MKIYVQDQDLSRVAITIDSSPSSNYLVALSLIVMTCWFLYYYCLHTPIPVAAHEQAAHALNQVDHGVIAPHAVNHPSQGFSKVLGSVLGSLPPWGWFLLVICSILLIFWLKKVNSNSAKNFLKTFTEKLE